MNRYRLAHVTEFHYDGPVSESHNVVRLRPRDDDTQSCLSFKLHTDPPSRASSYLDHWGNWVHSFSVLGEHRVLRIETHSLVHVDQPPAVPSQSISMRAVDGMRDELDEHFDFMAPCSDTLAKAGPPICTGTIDRAAFHVRGFSCTTISLVGWRPSR